MPRPRAPRDVPVTAAFACALLGLAAWALWHRYRLLTASPYPVGVDGYFYAVQLRALLEGGALHYPQAPLAFWLMAPLAAITDPIVGAKLGAAIAGALPVLPAFALGRRIGGSASTGLIAAAVVATSPSAFYMSTEFVKNSWGVAVAAMFAVALARALDAPTRGRVVAGAAAFAACVLTHKLAVVLAVVIAAPAVIVRALGGPRGLAPAGRRAGSQAPGHEPRPGPDPRRRVALVVLGFAGVAAALAALGQLAPDRFPGVADLSLLAGLLGPPEWTIPALRVPGQPALYFGHEAALAALVSAAALVLWLSARLAARRRPDATSRPLDPAPSTAASTGTARAGTPHDRALVLGPAAFALVTAAPVLDVSPEGLAFRLRLLAFVPLALAAAYVAGALASRLRRRARALVLAAVAAGLVAVRPAAPDEGVVRVHPAMQAAVRALAGVVPAGDTVIVPERHILFMVAWYTRTPARLRPEPVPPERRWRLLPLALISPALSAAIDRARASPPPGLARPRGLHPLHRNGLVVMPEATWRHVVSRLPPPQRAFYDRWVTI